MKRITYEYLYDKFIEDKKGNTTHVDDNGDIVRGYWVKDWCEGAEEVEDDKANEVIKTLSRAIYRNIKIE